MDIALCSNLYFNASSKSNGAVTIPPALLSRNVAAETASNSKSSLLLQFWMYPQLRERSHEVVYLLRHQASALMEGTPDPARFNEMNAPYIIIYIRSNELHVQCRTREAPAPLVASINAARVPMVQHLPPAEIVTSLHSSNQHRRSFDDRWTLVRVHLTGSDSLVVSCNSVSTSIGTASGQFESSARVAEWPFSTSAFVIGAANLTGVIQEMHLGKMRKPVCAAYH